MKERRNIVGEILAIQARRRTEFPQAELFIRLLNVEQSYNARDPTNKELLRYFPIALVACIESFFRLAIKSLVDSGDPYLNNAQILMARNNITFEVLRAFHGQSLKVGDIVGHSVSLSSLDLIDKNMTQLLEMNFLQKISEIHDRWAVEVFNKPKCPIIADPEHTYRYVAKTFELRHIFCHETASGFDFQPEDIDNCFEHSILFLKAAKEFIGETIHPNAPLTQSEMNVESANRYAEEKTKLEPLLAKVAGLLTPKQAEKFRLASDAWETFAQASVELEGLQYEGGSIRPTIENSAYARLTRERAEQVLQLIKSLETT